ncbi:MAG: hypothetical protein ACRDP7_17105 [Trebonia sp.]
MTGPQTNEDQASNWEPRLSVPKTTFMLPVVRDHRSLDELGREAAEKVYGSHAPEEQLQAFARFIHDGTKDCRQRGVKMGGLIFFPDFNRLPPVANVDVFGYYSSKGEDTPSSLEFYRQHFGTPDKDTVGPIEVSDVQLPAGPAIRFHRRFWPKPVPRWTPVSHQWEEVMYAVRPPQINDAVVLTVAWVEFKLSEALVKSADAIAKTLEIKLLDA